MLYIVDFLFKYNALADILLIGLLSTSVHAACSAYESIQEQKSCRTSSGEPARKNEFYQNNNPQDSFFTMLQQESLQKVETLQKDPVFQNIVTELQRNSSHSQNMAVNYSPETQPNLSEASLYIFISFSMGEKALLNIAHEAKRFGAIMILRGFKDESYLKTAQSLQNMIIKTGQGVLIDPELYALFNITTVPTFVLARPFNLAAVERTQTPFHDKMQGHVSVRYVLETFANKGDLKDEAHALLKRGSFKEGSF